MSTLPAVNGFEYRPLRLRAAIAALRGRGETVVCVLHDHGREIDEFQCNRELVERAGQWHVQPL